MINEKMPVDDFAVMHDFLNEIEIKLMGVDEITKIKFLRPIRNLLFEAWQDARNPEDSFLFPKNQNPTP